MELEVLPIILTIGIDSSNAEDIIKLITEKDKLDESDEESNVHDYIWKIDNKYYTADVRFASVNTKSSNVDHFRNNTEAVIFHIDHSIDDCVHKLNEWISTVNDFQIDVKILTTKYPLNGKRKEEVQQWCFENKFMPIEIECTKDEVDNDSDSEDNVGIDRVIEVLHTHQWSNLNIKRKTRPVHSVNDDQSSNLSCTNDRPLSSSQKPETTKSTTPDNGSLSDMDDLTVLFHNLQAMKMNISSLSHTERSKQAEKIAKVFWNAIGGDEDEFSNSDGEVT